MRHLRDFKPDSGSAWTVAYACLYLDDVDDAPSVDVYPVVGWGVMTDEMTGERTVLPCIVEDGIVPIEFGITWLHRQHGRADRYDLIPPGEEATAKRFDWTLRHALSQLEAK